MNLPHAVLRARSALRRAYVLGRQSYKAAARSLGRETIEAYWWNAPNFGDAITPTLLEQLSGLSAIWSKASVAAPLMIESKGRLRPPLG